MSNQRLMTSMVTFKLQNLQGQNLRLDSDQGQQRTQKKWEKKVRIDFNKIMWINPNQMKSQTLI